MLIDVLNEYGKPTGVAKTKQEIHEQGLLHATIHVWIYNAKGEVLLQLRAHDKDSYPGLLDISAAGHIDSGETPEEATLREVAEEIGLRVNPWDLQLIKVKKFSTYIPEIKWQDNEINYIYFYQYDGPVSALTMQPGEVDALTFIPLKQFVAEIKDPEKRKKYTPHDEAYYELILGELAKAIG